MLVCTGAGHCLEPLLLSLLSRGTMHIYFHDVSLGFEAVTLIPDDAFETIDSES